jgi:hypothetical protein
MFPHAEGKSILPSLHVNDYCRVRAARERVPRPSEQSPGRWLNRVVTPTGGILIKESRFV